MASSEKEAKLLRDADGEMKRMGVPVLDWLHAISKGGDSFGTDFELPQQKIAKGIQEYTRSNSSSTEVLCDVQTHSGSDMSWCRTWAEGLAHSSIHPNTSGHEKMLSAIDINIFQPQKAGLMLV